MIVLYSPFILQGLLMGIDEKLHFKRGLGRWERWGHPLDTLTVLLPFLFISFSTYSESHLVVYIVLAAFSCLFITKDEFIHSKECSGLEHWLHACLFILHPIVFLSAGILWMNNPADPILIFQPILIGAFMIYQILIWSISWK